MNLLIVYDVGTASAAGKRRLREVAKVCEGFGQRAQYSVFEVACSETDFAKLCARLTEVVRADEDSLRIYPLGANGLQNVIQLGLNRAIPPTDPWTL